MTALNTTTATPASTTAGMIAQASAEAVQAWENELDALGPFAEIDALEAHVAKAPADTELARFLTGYVLGRRDQAPEDRGLLDNPDFRDGWQAGVLRHHFTPTVR